MIVALCDSLVAGAAEILFQANGSVVAGPDAVDRPAVLDGKGELVGLFDAGVNWRHCMLSDKWPVDGSEHPAECLAKDYKDCRSHRGPRPLYLSVCLSVHVFLCAVCMVLWHLLLIGFDVISVCGASVYMTVCTTVYESHECMCHQRLTPSM